MTRTTGQLAAAGLFSASVLTMVIAIASADAPPPPTITVAEVPAPPTRPPGLPSAPNLFAPPPEGVAGPNGAEHSQGQQPNGQSAYVVVTAVNHAHPDQSCALVVNAGTMTHVCVGDTLLGQTIIAISDDTVALANGARITYSTAPSTNQVPAVSNGIGSQTVPVNIAQPAVTPVPPMASPTPQSQQFPNSPSPIATPVILDPNALPTANVIDPGGPQ